jgi:hypothetical protein
MCGGTVRVGNMEGLFKLGTQRGPNLTPLFFFTVGCHTVGVTQVAYYEEIK